MALPWLAVLKTVPWSDVISNAPMVADGAKKLWNAVSKKHAAQVHPEPVQERLAVAEAAVEDLNSQMLATSELIKALADQNAFLITRVEANRVRVLWLMGVSAVALVLSLVGLVVVLVR